MTDLIDERIEQIRERVRIGTVREAMADREFLLAEVDRLRREINAPFRVHPPSSSLRPMPDAYARSADL